MARKDRAHRHLEGAGAGSSARRGGSTSKATARAISRGHGGEQRAVFVYQIESYRYWEERLGRRDFTHGQFGENFTIEGLPDDEVCIGDRYRIGTALFEVTQPRATCYRVGIRMNEPQMAALLTSSGRPGFYLRVLEEGEVGAGDPIVQIARGTGAHDRCGGQCAAVLARIILAISSSGRCESLRCPRAGGGPSRSWYEARMPTLARRATRVSCRRRLRGRQRPGFSRCGFRGSIVNAWM